jgi:hypothetical protein
VSCSDALLEQAAALSLRLDLHYVRE